MAEERIQIRHFLWPDCKDCGGKCTDTKFCKECQPGILKTEAIEKMCEGYFKAKDKGLTESERVEAALNALLEKGE